MADDKKKVGKADRSKVAVMEKYEVDYLAKRHGVKKKDVKAAVEMVGNDRAKVEAVLERSQVEALKVAAKKPAKKTPPAPAKKSPRKKAVTPAV